MKKKIVLYNPQAEEFRPFKGIPLGLLSISRILNKEGYKTCITEHFEKNVEEQVLEECKDSICFGVTAMTGYQIQDALKMVKKVKAKYPKLPIVWGGWHSSILPLETIKSKYVDIIVRGQGEETFTELVHTLEKNQSLDDVAGIVFKKKEKIIVTKERPFSDLNTFPPMPYDLVDVEKHLMNYDFGKRTIQYNASQGCPFRCAFCADPEVYKRRWSGLKPERVVSELKVLKNKYHIDAVVFTDSNFFISEKYTIEFCKLCIKEKLNLKFGGVNGRADVLTKYKKSTWLLMKRAGIKNILNGTESGSQEILDYITKDITVEQIKDMVKIGTEYNISITCSTFIGLPGQDIEKEFKINIDLIDSLMKINSKNTYFFSIYTPYPGCKMYSESIKHGFKQPKNLESWAKFELRKANTPWVSDKYANMAEQLCVYYFPILSNQIDDIIKHHGILLRIPLKIGYQFFRIIAKIRWKLKFFSLPVDYHLFKYILYLKEKL